MENQRNIPEAKEGESRIPSQHFISSGSPCNHFAACDTCSFSVTAPTCWSLLAFSLMIQLRLILMCSLLHFSPLMNILPMFVYKRASEANPTSPQIRKYFLSSGPPSSPAHTESGQRACLSLRPHSTSPAKRCGGRKSILLPNLAVTTASQTPGCKQML